MGNWTWDSAVSLVCLLAAIAFTAVLLFSTLQKRSKTVPSIGLICSVLLLAGVTLTAQLPNILGGGLGPASIPDTASSTPTQTTVAKKTASTASLSRIDYAEKRLGSVCSDADVNMKQAESRFSSETTGSASSKSAKSSASSASSAASKASGIQILRAPGSVARGNVAQLTIQGKGNTQYRIKILYDSGSTDGTGSEMSVQSDTFGRASWAWTVGKDIEPGAHFITITGGGETLTTSFTTT